MHSDPREFSLEELERRIYAVADGAPSDIPLWRLAELYDLHPDRFPGQHPWWRAVAEPREDAQPP